MTELMFNLIAFFGWVCLFCAALGIAGLISDAARRHDKKGVYDLDLAETIADDHAVVRDHDKAA